MKMWNLMKFKKLYLIFSFVVLIPGLISILIYGLNLSIDFTGGSVFTYAFDSSQQNGEVLKEELNTVFSANEIEVSSILILDNSIEVRSENVPSQKNDQLNSQIQNLDLGLYQTSFESVGPSFSKETTLNAFKALMYAAVGILIYIAYAFRNVPKPYSGFRFGISALVAMVHDALMLLGVFSILGLLIGVQIDTLFVTAMLTVIGFSVHDSIVVFDRVRENLRKLPSSWTFEQVVNFSIVETLNRSIATSLTVLVTLLSLYVLGGETIKDFTLALLIGILSGAYSSIFTASPFLVLWEERLLQGDTTKNKFKLKTLFSKYLKK